MTPSNHGTHQASGFAIVYIAVAIVVIGVIGAALARISMSSVSSSVQLQQLNIARYLAESGLEYARGVAAYEKSQGKSIDHTINTLNANSGRVSVADLGSFALAATKNGSNILVVSKGYAKSGLASYIIPGTLNITYGSNAASNEALKGIYSGISAGISGNFVGNFATYSPILNGGANIQGSLIYLEKSATCLNINGSVHVGTVGGSDYVCSDACVVISGNPVINGNIYSQGDVTVISGTVNGDIHSGGNVSLDWGAQVNGDIYTHGTFSQPQYYTGFTRRVFYNQPIPNMCTSYTLPNHENVPSSNALRVGWSGPNTSTYTFYGSTNIADHSNAFSSINSAGGTKICFDLSAPNTYLNIFDSGDMNINGDLYVRTSTSTSCFDSVNRVSTNFANTAAAKRVYMDVQGTVTFNGGSNWFGTIYAKGNINTGGGGTYIGAYYTNQSFNPNNSGGLNTIFVESSYVDKYWP